MHQIHNNTLYSQFLSSKQNTSQALVMVTRVVYFAAPVGHGVF